MRRGAVFDREAAEACLSGQRLQTQIRDRLAALHAQCAGEKNLMAFLTGSFEPLLQDIEDGARRKMTSAGLDFGTLLPQEKRTLVPSDFGFHNSLRRADGTPLPGSGQAILFFPSGARGPAFLVTDNFEVIKRYNNSDVYALAAAQVKVCLGGQAADEVFGGYARYALTQPLTVAAGQSVSVHLTFTPQSSGSASANLSFASNATNSTLSEALTGTGTPAPEGAHSQGGVAAEPGEAGAEEDKHVCFGNRRRRHRAERLDR